MRTVIAGVAFALMMVGSALAEEQTTPTTQDPGDEIICRTIATATGTRLGRAKECHSKREWDARRAQDRQMTDETQMRDSRGPKIPGT